MKTSVRMKFFVSLLLLLSAFLWGCSDSSHHTSTPITISVVEMSPNSFTQNGEIVGIDVDTATAAMDEAGVDYVVEMEQSSTVAYDNTLNGSNRALLGIGYSAERQDLFKWVGPTSSSGYYVFAKKDSGLGSTLGLDGTKALDSIAVVTGWLETTSLEDLGFDNLVYYATYDEAVGALLDGDVQALASDGKQLAYKVQGQFSFSDDFDVCFGYKSAFYYIAFSKDVSDEVVAAVQASLDDLIKTNETLAILQRYFPDANETMLPDVLQLFTEVAPPFNYYSGSIVDPDIQGSSVEIVDAIQSRNDYAANVKITGWIDAYATVQYLPNSALFTTARTAEREGLFQWVGPIATLRGSFYTLRDSGITITTLEEAKALGSVATPSNWYTHDYLLANGFDNIVATSFSPLDAFNQLLSGEVDALFMYDEGINWLCDTTSTPTEDIVKQFEETYDEGYVAFSLTTPTSTVEQWQQNLDAMKQDGTFEGIWQSWFDGSELP
ncbi:transporter substrate-binding domain-containing protein [Desulfuromonas acetoxidans]|uniref:ABC-type amino acid transport/signal transduction systems periplasmic component/domain-like n=1 Tax=Desulfuromonas acetoxidans (strain DSM 684 / 11070) TaxID=281689 RepID=Q1K360_DESA6|nr:transporter substrate-binding domain-containing protein [Desulfuromonas acetoxidans]EAT17114.1 ABC-type amino acid transport/signal transduction systems periplasmic component/domain-like [Desulfuromonas acetoxidans DSM 684]MBF0645662.1 transporter substrate-binding domain-containing protein [Desulfuromonas acetoxidans]NVD24121.1 transporter substrate-binding domain-containing protein [Desulfuromonas acetoxidans]NVE16417.1 transporter substrate-binding domain-containing protein [Desulfuromona